MKQYFIDKLDMIKEWLKKEKWFLILLSVMTVSLFVSMFTEYALLLCIIATIICSLVFNIEYNLSFFLFCYAFETIFLVSINGKLNNTYTSMYSIIVAVCFLKHLINVINKKEQLNLNYLIPIAMFIFYILLSMRAFNFTRIVRYCVVLGFVYLLLEYKEKLRFDNILLYASIGVIISILFSFFAENSARMLEIKTDYYNYGIKKVQGLFSNPNHFAIYIILILTFVLYNFVDENELWGIAFFIMYPYSYLNFSRNYILCLMFTLLMITIFICIKRKKSLFFKYIASMLLIVIVSVSQLNITKVYINRVGTIYNEACQLVGINNNDNKKPSVNIEINTQPEQPVIPNDKVWVDGTAIDPGRAGIWKRYIKDYTSSVNVILFGRGIVADELGMGVHNSFIEIIWRLGLIGTILLCYIFYLLARELLKRKSYLLLMILGVTLIINLFESCFFNSIAIMMILALLSSIKKEVNYEKSISNNTCV